MGWRHLPRPLLRRVAPAWADQDYLARRFERDGPVFTYRELGRPVVAIRGTTRGRHLLTEAAGRLTSPPLPWSHLIPYGFIRFMTPEARSRYRPLLAAGFTPRVASAHKDALAAACRATISDLDDERDLRVALRELALDQLVLLTSGLPAGDPDARRLRECAVALPIGHGPVLARRRARRHLAEGTALLRARSRSGDPSFAGEILSRAAGLDDTVGGNLIYLIRLAANDVSGALHWLVFELAHHPRWLGRIAADGAQVADAVVAETLRLHQSEYLLRRAAGEVDWDRMRLPAGRRLRICIAESHREHALFASPETFDPERFLAAEPPGADIYRPFGGPHTSCLGAGVALAILRMFACELARFEVSVTADGPSEYDDWHWRPSRGFRIGLSARDRIS